MDYNKGLTAFMFKVKEKKFRKPKRITVIVKKIIGALKGQL